MAGRVDPILESVEIFMKVKKVIDEIDDQRKREDASAKLRSRAREIPEMILELGLVPTLTYCLAKASANCVVKTITIMEKSKPLTDVFGKDKVKPEELAYALFTYVTLKYLATIIGKVGEVELKMEELAEMGEKGDEREAQNMLINYLNALLNANASASLHGLLWPYLLQFKKLCEATFESERG